ncbi:MAG: DUF6488 family protein [Bdellovibrionales bacterium]
MNLSILIFTLLFSLSGYTGPGHGHSHDGSHSHSKKARISEEAAKTKGLEHIKRLIKLEKIDPSWSEAVFDKSVKKGFRRKKEWVVTFNNQNGKKGKKLYIFLKMDGQFVAANFSGK